MGGKNVISEKPEDRSAGDGRKVVTPEAAEVKEEDSAGEEGRKFVSRHAVGIAMLLQISLVPLGGGFYVLLMPILGAKDKTLIFWSLLPFTFAALLQRGAFSLVKRAQDNDQKKLLTSVWVVGYAVMWSLMSLEGAVFFCTQDDTRFIIIGVCLVIFSLVFDYFSVRLFISSLRNHNLSFFRNLNIQKADCV